MRNTIYLSATAVAAFLAWSTQATVPELVRAEARVIPQGRTQPIQHLEGGVVEAVLAREGERVQRGQVLLRIAPVQAEAQAGEQQATIDALKARIARLEGELEGRNPSFPDGLPDRLIREEAAIQDERRLELAARLDTLAREAEGQRAAARAARAEHTALGSQLDVAERQAASLRRLADQGAGPKGDADRAAATAAEVRARMAGLPDRALAAEQAAEAAAGRAAEARASFAATTRRELAEALGRLGTVEETRRGSLDRVARTEVTSPVTGLIQTVTVASGRVARPGETLAEVVPTEDGLVLEARIRAADIGSIAPGLPVRVRVSAYDYTRYGSLDAKVVEISPDSVIDERTREVFYRARLQAQADRIGDRPISVGMTAQADIVSGQKTVFEYLLGPVAQIGALALTER